MMILYCHLPPPSNFIATHLRLMHGHEILTYTKPDSLMMAKPQLQSQPQLGHMGHNFNYYGILGWGITFTPP